MAPTALGSPYGCQRAKEPPILDTLTLRPFFISTIVGGLSQASHSIHSPPLVGSSLLVVITFSSMWGLIVSGPSPFS